MSQLRDTPVETFTIAFEEKDFDESALARLVAQKFNTNHHEYTVKSDSFEESLQRIIYHCDEPFGDSSAIPTGYVSTFAREKVKVVLTGDGGDEVLSGYSSYQGEKLAAIYKKLPSFIQKGAPAILKTMAPFLTGKYRYKMNRAHRVLQTSRLDFQDRLFNKVSGNITRETIDDLIQFKTYPCKDYLNDFFNGCSYKDSFYQLMYFNFKISLPDDMLVKVDRMSMAYSLETRAPFLDHRLIEYMVKVDKRIKMKGFERKSILRQTIGKRLPNELLKAPKKGFVVPILTGSKSSHSTVSGTFCFLIRQLLINNLLNVLLKTIVMGLTIMGIFYGCFLSSQNGFKTTLTNNFSLLFLNIIENKLGTGLEIQENDISRPVPAFLFSC